MEPVILWIYGLYILIGGGLAIAASREVRQFQVARQQALQDTLKLHGLTVVSLSEPPRPLRLEGRTGRVTVRVEDAPDRGRKKEYGTVVTALLPGPPGFLGVRLRPEKDKPDGAREIEVGDDRFDGAFFVEGPARLLTVILDAETRRLLADLSREGRLSIAGGEVRIDTYDKNLTDILPLLLDLAGRLTGGLDVARRLAENARQDSVAAVRLRNLLVLTREFPGEPGTIEALRAACTDASPQVRLRAAMGLGAEGREVLVATAEGLEDDACSAQAVAHLGRELPVERIRGLLARALRRRHLQTVHACLGALGASGDPAAVEPALLQALRHEAADIRIAAAQALGRVGTAAAVLPLKEAAESAGRDPELRRATRQAIGEIQSRLAGASPGQLSLAGLETGQLSFAADPAGQLSLPPEREKPDRQSPGLGP